MTQAVIISIVIAVVPGIGSYPIDLIHHVISIVGGHHHVGPDQIGEESTQGGHVPTLGIREGRIHVPGIRKGHVPIPETRGGHILTPGIRGGHTRGINGDHVPTQEVEDHVPILEIEGEHVLLPEINEVETGNDLIPDQDQGRGKGLYLSQDVVQSPRMTHHWKGITCSAWLVVLCSIMYFRNGDKNKDDEQTVTVTE